MSKESKGKFHEEPLQKPQMRKNKIKIEAL